MRERARQMSPQPELNPASREPLNFKFNAQSVREIGPRTWSFGASRSLWQPKTLDASGFWKLVTVAPEELVKFMTPPETRPKYLVPGWSANGVTVSVVVAYFCQTRLI